MKFLIVSTCVLLLASSKFVLSAEEEKEDFSKCLDKDSISCLQLTLFRRAKNFFEKPTIELFGGLSLKKVNDIDRQGKSIEDNSIAIETAKSVESRNSEMETYLLTKGKNFFQERSLNFNFVEAARSIASKIPEDIKTDVRDLVVEGRLKKKKLIRKLLPIILGLKAKLAILGIISLFGILLLAKKALVVAVAALGLALFSGLAGLARGGGGGGGSGGSGGNGGGFLSRLSGLFGGGGGGTSTTSVIAGGGWGPGNGWSSGGGGWSGGGYGGGWDSHGAYSSPVAHSIAYSGQHQARRR